MLLVLGWAKSFLNNRLSICVVFCSSNDQQFFFWEINSSDFQNVFNKIGEWKSTNCQNLLSLWTTTLSRIVLHANEIGKKIIIINFIIKRCRYATSNFIVFYETQSYISIAYRYFHRHMSVVFMHCRARISRK